MTIPGKYQNYLLVIALVLSSIAMSIRSKDGEVIMVLQEYPVLIFLLLLMSSGLVTIYFSMNRRNITRLSDQIKEQSHTPGEEYQARVSELTERQREVYNLIISGKSNKEIMNLLFIEQSTLKTHINQNYNKLNIKSRRELKSKINR